MLSTHARSPRLTWLQDLLWITLLISVFYIAGLGHYPLFIPDEARYSEIAREMLLTHDYVTPRLNGIAFLDKPILYYWLQASAIKLFGLHEWALRFWPAILGILGCIMLYISGRFLFNRRTGRLAAFILATTPLYYGAAHYANLDLEVAVWVSASLLCTLMGFHPTCTRRAFCLRLAYVFCGLAILTKGLIGFVFPTLIIGLWFLLLNQWKNLPQLLLGQGLLIILIINLPWYISVQINNHQFFHFFFVTQQFQRFLTHGDFNNRSPIWFYIPIIAAGFMPWTLFLIQSLLRSLKNYLKNRTISPQLLFLVLWILVVLVFFSIPTSKTVGYILPILPPLALSVAHAIDLQWSSKRASTLRLAYLVSLGSAVIVLILLTQYAGILNKKSTKSLALTLKAYRQPNDQVITYYHYYQDLPLYLDAPQPIMIVADWHDPNIIHHDNWQRELWFGMPFQNTQTILIEPDVFWKHWHHLQPLSTHGHLFVVLPTTDYPAFLQATHSTAQLIGVFGRTTLIRSKHGNFEPLMNKNVSHPQVGS